MSDESDSLAAEANDPRNRPGGLQVFVVLLLIAISLSALFNVGYKPQEEKRRALEERTASAVRARPTVVAVPLKRAPAIEDLELPGGLRASQSTTIVPRATGYVRRWLVDIGDSVQAGQLLAEIETPEREQELLQARQAVAQVQARLGSNKAQEALVQATLNRYKSLRASGGVSEQDLAEREAQLNAARSTILETKANIAAAEANVQRLTELLAFNRVTAPFAGTITSRTAEVGALVNAGAAPGLYTLVQTDPLNVLVNVPQAYSAALSAGTTAAITIPDLPGRAIRGTLTRTARALDPSSRTMLAQIEVANPDHALIPGMYARVRLRLSRPRVPLLVPAGALVFNASGTHVLELANGRIRRQKVELDVDRGTEYTVLSGLTGEFPVVLNPSDDLTEGQEVEPVAGAHERTSPGYGPRPVR